MPGLEGGERPPGLESLRGVVMSTQDCHIPACRAAEPQPCALQVEAGTAGKEGREKSPRDQLAGAGGASPSQSAGREWEGATGLERQMPSAPQELLKSLCGQDGWSVCRGPQPPWPPLATCWGCLSWVRTPGSLLPGLHRPFLSLLSSPSPSSSSSSSSLSPLL